MDTSKIISDLKSERDRIDEAITAIEALEGTVPAAPGAATPATKAAPKPPQRRGLTSAGRKRLSEMMKKRWAERRGKVAAKPVPNKTGGRRIMSAASRRKIAEAQRARWAAVKKAQKTLVKNAKIVKMPAAKKAAAKAAPAAE
jgi:hypothetical protein